MRRDPGLAFVLLAVLAAALLYAPTLTRGVVDYDDTWLVRDNFLLHSVSGTTLHRVFFDTSAPTRFLLGAEYLPVRDLSVMLDLSIWGDWFPGHHLTNLLLYIAALVVWFRVLETFGVDRTLAGLAILLWAVHPTHAESVAWLSERKGLLACSFAGVAALAYGRYRAGASVRWLVLASFATVCAMWSKAPSAFTLAALGGFELALPARRRSWRRALGGLGVMAMVGALAFVPVLMTATGLSVVGARDLAPAGRLEMALGLHGFYLELGMIAFRNAVSYPISSLGPSLFQIALGVIGLVVIGGVAVLPSLTRRPIPAVLRAAAWLWLLTWLPASRLVLPLKAILVTDRYALMPTLALAIAIAWFLLSCLKPDRARTALAVTLLVAAGVRTFDAQSNWRDSSTLWQRAVTSNPYDGDAWSAYAEALDQAGDPELAIDAVATGLRHSRAPRLLFRKALLVLEHGQRTQALSTMTTAAEAGEPRAMSNLALMLVEEGKPYIALMWARRAVAAAPMYAKGYRNLGAAALAAKQPEEAYRAFEHAYELWPFDLANRYNLGAALVELHRYDEARVHLYACLADRGVGEKARALLRQLPQR